MRPVLTQFIIQARGKAKITGEGGGGEIKLVKQSHTPVTLVSQKIDRLGSLRWNES